MADIDNPYAPTRPGVAAGSLSYRPSSIARCMLALAGVTLAVTYCVGLPGFALPQDDLLVFLVSLPFVPLLSAIYMLAEHGLSFLLIIVVLPVVALGWIVAMRGWLAAIVLMGISLGILNGVLVRLYLYGTIQ